MTSTQAGMTFLSINGREATFRFYMLLLYTIEKYSVTYFYKDVCASWNFSAVFQFANGMRGCEINALPVWITGAFSI